MPDKDTTEARPEWGRTLDSIARLLAEVHRMQAELEAGQRPRPIRRAAMKRRVRPATMKRRGARRRLPAGGAR